MLIVIICACIVGGMWWKTENKIKKINTRLDVFEYSHGKIINGQRILDEKTVLLAKDMLEMQTTVSNLQYKAKNKSKKK